MPRKLWKLSEEVIAADGIEARSPTYAPPDWGMVVQWTGMPTTEGCAHCDCESRALLRCSRCMVARYCSKPCQAAHWKAGHKTMCAEYRRDEASSYEPFNTFVAAYGRAVDPVARDRYMNGLKYGRLKGLTCEPIDLIAHAEEKERAGVSREEIVMEIAEMMEHLSA